MTNTPLPASPATPCSADLMQELTDYRPEGLSAELWLPLAPDAIALALSAGPMTRMRVRKDLTTLASVAAYLTTTKRPLTIAEILQDATLSAYDAALQAAGRSDGTRINQRGILRRLQAAHRGLPWRKPRRDDGQRIDRLMGPAEAQQLIRLETLARERADGLAVAFSAAFRAVRAADGRLAGGADAPALQPPSFLLAVAFAAEHGLRLTRRMLAAATTHALLAQDLPLAVVARQNGMTRPQLELGLTYASGLPQVPVDEHRSALRGPVLGATAIAPADRSHTVLASRPDGPGDQRPGSSQ